MPITTHAVQRLYDFRLNKATKPFKSRGHKTVRCKLCQCAAVNCICQYKAVTTSDVGFCLLMYDDEVLKPSNTGRLIADLIPDTFAYIWSRTEQDDALLALIQSDCWQPYIVFPRHDATKERVVYETVPQNHNGKKPLFILFDGTWREARKMFRKSPYLAKFPIISLPIGENTTNDDSSYFIRKNAVDGQLATAEVAAVLLNDVGENYNAKLLYAWFELFSYQYQRSVTKPNQGNLNALENLLALTHTDG